MYNNNNNNNYNLNSYSSIYNKGSEYILNKEKFSFYNFLFYFLLCVNNMYLIILFHFNLNNFNSF